ncbi:MAG: tetratricopeptide repeat protein, partial [Bryobacteraceae bacterium]
MALRLLIAILILAVPAELPGCGPFLPEALFFDPVRPERPAQEFATGQLGILLPSYERFYQVIAYRYLTGVGLNAAERREVLHTGPVPRESVLSSGGFENRNPWLAARNKVPGVKPIDDLDAYREVKREGYFDTYLNCNDDAFSTAAATLRDRIKPLGTEPTADWIAAQDTVFENCSKGTATPPLASDPRLAAARAYQIASAEFYSEQYDSARQHFQAIAANETSPWHGVAPYLAARCLIRSGNLGGAENELQRIAADPALARWHAPAESLLGYVRLRLQPGERMHELAAALVLPDSEATISQDLTDYRFLFDK